MGIFSDIRMCPFMDCEYPYPDILAGWQHFEVGINMLFVVMPDKWIAMRSGYYLVPYNF